MRREKEGDASAYLVTGEDAIERLDDSFLIISQTLPNHKALLNELKQLRDRQNERFARFARTL